MLSADKCALVQLFTHRGYQHRQLRAGTVWGMDTPSTNANQSQPSITPLQAARYLGVEQLDALARQDHEDDD